MPLIECKTLEEFAAAVADAIKEIEAEEARSAEMPQPDYIVENPR